MLVVLAAGSLAGVLGHVLLVVAGRDARTVLPVSWRLPLALAAAVLAAAGSAAVGSVWDSPLVVVLAAFGVVLGAVDARSKLLPNALLLRFVALAAPLLVLAAAGTGNWAGLLGAAAGGASLFVVYFLLALISPGGMGMGDVKLSALLGLLGGWGGVSVWMGTLLGGFLLGGLAGIGVLLLRSGSRGSTFPFGPGMLLAAFASFVLLR
ncbi:prepilin peptidase [Vibrio cholerae]|nr:prepilin peptidase [Vibrio cholerae]